MTRMAGWLTLVRCFLDEKKNLMASDECIESFEKRNKVPHTHVRLQWRDTCMELHHCEGEESWIKIGK
jgi:hypothetical protein